MAPEAQERVSETLRSGYIGQGPRTEEFEEALGQTLGLPSRPLALSSCTHAIDLALHLVGVGPGDTVISTPVTCTATNSPIVTRGAKIAWTDVNKYTGNISPESIADVYDHTKPKAKCVICVNWSGRSCDYKKIRELCPGLFIIEDAAHGPLRGKVEGETHVRGGDIVCYSFQAIKHLTCGDGGALYVSGGWYDRAKLLRWYGLDRTKGDSFRCSQNIQEVGYKYHMNDISASIGLANISNLINIVRAHRRNAFDLSNFIQNWPIYKQGEFSGDFWIFTLLLPTRELRDELKAFLDDYGIDSSQVHARNDKHTGFKKHSYPIVEPPKKPGDVFPGATGVDYFDAAQLSIPCGWWLTAFDKARIFEALEDFGRKHNDYRPED